MLSLLILLAAIAVTGYHALMLIVYVFIAKLFVSPFGLMRLVMKPSETIKTAGKGLGKIVKHITWCICGTVVIAFIMA